MLRSRKPSIQRVCMYMLCCVRCSKNIQIQTHAQPQAYASIEKWTVSMFECVCSCECVCILMFFFFIFNMANMTVYIVYKVERYSVYRAKQNHSDKCDKEKSSNALRINVTTKINGNETTDENGRFPAALIIKFVSLLYWWRKIILIV